MRKATSKHISKLNEVIEQRGYLVIGSTYKHEIGDQIQGWMHGQAKVDRPATIICETDQADATAQGMVLGKGFSGWPYYYRIAID